MATIKSVSKNLAAFLDMIAFSEGTANKGDDGYNVICGGKLFSGYADHPRELVPLPRLNIKSTAAGRYQILSKYFDHYKKQLGLNDFGKEAQDKIAIQLIRECHALDDIDAGRIDVAISKCRSRWASLPGSGYGQRENKLPDLLASFEAAKSSMG